MVLGVLLLRDSGFDHFGDAAGGKREGEDYQQVFHGSVSSPGRGESQCVYHQSRQKREFPSACKATAPPGTSDERSCAHAVVDTTDVLSVRGGGVYQREECNNDSAEVYGTGEELCGIALLGEGVLRVDGGRDEAEVRKYIQTQEKEDRRLDQLKMFE
jgi:hypothetical protein